MTSLKGSLLNIVISVSLIAAAIPLFPIHILKSNETADNPQNCPYYITLQSLLTNYQTMSYDKANAAFIKTKIAKFERDSTQLNFNTSIAAKYKNQYDKILSNFHIQTINSASNAAAVTIAGKTYKVIDDFYLNEKLFCRNPLYSWGDQASRRILHYNFGGMLDKLQSKFVRIQSVIDSGAHLGVFPGFIVNNQTTALGTQFMTGLPLLTAMYVIPTYTYPYLGSYRDSVPWCAFWSGYMTDKRMRKIMNVVGIDVFLASMKDVNSRIARKEITGIPNVIPLQSDIRKDFIENQAQVFLNPDSYGMIYLANTLHYQDLSEINKQEAVIKQFYARPLRRNTNSFIKARDFLYEKIYDLKQKHDVIIESPTHPKAISIIDNSQPGNAAISGLVGRHIAANADCRRDHCTLVLNVAASQGWHAIVNGKSSPIERANFAFISTTIPHGKADIWFIYEPASQLLSYFLSILTLIGILTLTLITIKQDKTNVKTIEKSFS